MYAAQAICGGLGGRIKVNKENSTYFLSLHFLQSFPK